MELVEGEDLADRLKRGPVTLDEALPIARQIAEALEAAHEAGIVHRDLKPANIKVRARRSGEGARFRSGEGGCVPTRGIARGWGFPNDHVARDDQRGVVLGTAAYMVSGASEGTVVDRRSDIWAFGCVLYEMLTARHAFSGDTVTETITSVLRDTPDWQQVPAGTPAAIHKLLRKCLEKDRAKRIDSAASVRMEIEDVLAGGIDHHAAVPPARGRERLAWTLAAIFALAAIASTAIALRLLRQPAPLQEVRLDISTPDAADPYSFALSPDGTKIVFVAGGDNGPLRLWLRSFDTGTATPVPDTDGAVHPFWSPDSQAIGFFANGKLKRVDVAGGAAVTLADAAASRGGSWNADGTILFSQIAAGPVSRVAATGSGFSVVTALAAGQGGHQFPVWHPDGRRFIYFINSGDPEVRGIYLATVDSPGSTRIVAADGSGQFRLPGQLVYAREETLFAQSFDDATNTVTGTPIALANPVPSRFGRTAFSISASGPLAYRTGRVMGAQLRWFGRGGDALEAFAEPDLANPLGPVLSPSERRVAIRRTVQGNEDVWILDSKSGTPTRLTFDPGPDTFPVWAPDDSRLVFRSNRVTNLDLYQAPAMAERGDELLLAASRIDATALTPTDWSADGRWFLFYENTPGTTRDLWVLPMGSGDAKPSQILATKFDESTARFSPNGRWIAYQTNDSGRFEIVVRAFSTGGRVWQVSSGGGVQARWSRDGKELYFVAPDGKLMAVPVDGSGPAFRAGPPVALFTPRFVESASVNPFTAQYDVARDGRFLINMSLDNMSEAPITLILNWKSGAR